MNNSKIKKYVMLAVVIAIICVGGYAAFIALFGSDDASTGTVYTYSAVELGDISVGVAATGTLAAGDGGVISIPYERSTMNVMMTYEVDEVLVQSGDTVSEGDVIMTLLSDDLDDMIEEAEESLDSLIEELCELLNITESEIPYIKSSDGVTIYAPIDGSVSDFSLSYGDEVTKTSVLGTVVDDSEIIIEAYLTSAELSQLIDGTSKAVFSVSGYTYVSEAEITNINYNATAVKSNSLTVDTSIGVDNSDDSYTFVYYVTLTAENPGLYYTGMSTSVGFYEPEDGYEFTSNTIPDGVRWLRYTAQMTEFAEESNIITTTAGTVTEIYVSNNSVVSAGDPIVTLAGDDIEEDINDLLDEYDAISDMLEELYTKYENTTITAPISGMVSEISVAEGDSVYEGQTLGEIFSSEEMYLNVYVDDIDIVNVSYGSQVLISLDSLPDEYFYGYVTYVSGTATSGYYSVTITLSGSDSMREGMSALAYIDSGSASSVMVIPSECVYKQSGVYYVEILIDGEAYAQAIEIGLSNDTSVQVTSGLEVGDLVVTGSTSAVLATETYDDGSTDSSTDSSSGTSTSTDSQAGGTTDMGTMPEMDTSTMPEMDTSSMPDMSSMQTMDTSGMSSGGMTGGR